MGNRIKSSVFMLAAMASLIFTGCSAANPPIVPNPIQPIDPSPTMAANEWTWVSGSNVAGQPGTYGTEGTAAAGNVPGARAGAAGWTDASGNLWLFGGAGAPVGGGCNQFDPLCWAGTNSYYNDLWKFDGSEWTWVAGSNTTDQAGVYGALGVAAGGNAPGARYGAVSWIDASGSLWLFGGTGYDSAGNTNSLNDLWKFSSGEWAWMGGAKVVNQPGIYGTMGTASATNFPGARSNAIAFSDASGNFWLFGGQGCDSTQDCGGALNDLWKYSNGQWTWMSGLSVSYPAQPGVYGTLGTPGPGNSPGGRYSQSGWMDASGNLWVFGGVGYGAWDDNVGGLSDLWKYSGGEWAWMNGQNSSPDALGVYGTEGTPAASNAPGTRYSAMSWTDAKGNLWLFGGEGFASSFSNSGPFLNDLWEYGGGEWAWMGGASAGGQYGVYGTQRTPAATNVPGARIGGVTWTDTHGNLWLFGGIGLDSTGSGLGGNLNDLWVYQP